MDNTAPVDKHHAHYFMFLLFGVGILYPWQAFITAYDFFLEVFGESSHFEFLFGFFFQIPSCTSSFIMTKYGHKIPLFPRIIISFLITIAVIVFMPFVPKMDLAKASMSAIVYGCVSLCGLTNGVLWSISGIASWFPQATTAGLMTGNAVAGIMVAGIRILTKVAMPNDPDTSAILYFMLGVVMLVACIACLVVLPKSAYARYYMNSQGSKTDDQTTLLDETEQVINATKYASYTSPLKHAADMGACAFGNFFITLLLFPGLVTEIAPRGGMWGDPKSGWFQIAILTSFMIGDFLGRAASTAMEVSRKTVVWWTVGRVLLIPLVIICVNPLWLVGDGWGLIICLVMGVMCGYFGTKALVYATQGIRPEHKTKVSIFITLCMNLGILSGSVLAIALLYIVLGVTPF